MNNLIPGTVVSVMAGPIEHFGIISDSQIAGIPSIISNSHRSGEVAEESADIFSRGKTIKVHGYPGKLTSSAVLARARSMLGKPYNLLTWNCEHFTRWAHGLNVKSPQLQAAVITGLIALSLIYLARKK